ncbi:MAG: hypothetical protein ACE14S_08800 [Candidatus Bathyarchaeia archaeon]
MTAQDEVNEIVLTLRNAVASAIGEKPSEKVAIEIKELTRIGSVFSIVASYRITPFLGGRAGRVNAVLTKSETGYEIASLRIDDKGL